MPRLRIAPRARSDLRNILATSEATWGPDAAARYADTLASVLAMISTTPHGPGTRARGELLAGLRSAHVRWARGKHGVHAPVHVVHFRVAAEVVEVIRVLHERMDPGSHLRGPATRTRRASTRK